MGADRDSVQARIDRAVARRDWAEALRLVDDAIRHQPGSFPLLRRRAELLEVSGQIDRAVDAYRHLAEVCVSQGYHSRAAAVRNKVARLCPDRPDVAEAIGRAIEERQRAEAASRPAVRRGWAGRERPAAAPPSYPERAPQPIPVTERQAASEFLRSLPVEAVEPFLAAGRSRRISPGEIVFREGEPGTSLFYIEEGTVNVTTSDPEGRPLPLGPLGPGEIFGEVSVLSERPRTATVAAVERVVALEIDREGFVEASRNHPEVREALEGLVRKRARATADAVMRARSGNGTR